MKVDEQDKKRVTAIRMESDLKARGQEAARKLHLTFSEWVRRAIELALRRAM